MKKLTEEIRKRNKFLITAHIDPDGDSIGSQLAVFSLLRELRKEAIILSEKEVPEKYRFLPFANEIVTEIPERFECENVVVLDSATLDRIGRVSKHVQGKFIINIDHHPTNRSFGDVNWVVPGASSTSELIYGLVKSMGMRIGADRASCLYAGILTDTGGFTFANTTSDSLRIASLLVEEGADPAYIATEVYLNRSTDDLLLLSRLLATAEVHGAIATMHLTRSMMRDLRVNTEGFSNNVLQLKGVEMGILFKEMDGEVKVSLRSRGKIDVSILARKYGGGGHKAAAACVVPGRFSEVKKELLEAGKRLYGWDSPNQ